MPVRSASLFLSRLLAPLAAGLALSGVLALAGCTPSIGDSCQVSTNCSSQGDRLCDLSQPGGYCTVFNCQPNACPDEAACILYHPAVPGCSYSDRGAQRSSKSFCMKTCTSNSNCRDGYVCADPKADPWQAFILDDNQGQRVCMPAPSLIDDAGLPADAGPDAGPSVCLGGSVFTPGEIDGGSVSSDAGADAGPSDAGAGDASADGGKDGGK
jgi:hypothetical protein